MGKTRLEEASSQPTTPTKLLTKQIDILHELKESLREFEKLDATLTVESKKAYNYLILTKDKALSFTLKELALIDYLITQYNVLINTSGFWTGVINQKIDEIEVQPTLENINSKMGDPNSNVNYRNRLEACLNIANNTPRLQKLLLSKGIGLDDSLSPAWQYFPRQPTFVSRWAKLVRKLKLNDCVKSVSSLERKYNRASAIFKQLMKAFDEAVKRQADPSIITEFARKGLSSAIQSTPHKTNTAKNETLDNSDSITVEHDTTLIAVTPKKINPKSVHTKSDKLNFEKEISYMLEASDQSGSDRDSVEKIDGENVFEIAEKLSNKIETYFSPKKAVAPTKSSNLDLEQRKAKESISSLDHLISSSNRPVRFFGGRKHIDEDGNVMTIPHNEKKIRMMMASFREKKLNNYRGLACDILHTAIEAEHNKPLFGARTKETSTFYGNMIEILGVDMDATLNNIKEFIDSKNKEYWGTRIHDRPTTVNKILSTINDSSMKNKDKLKEVIFLSQHAAETNGEMSIFKLRSKNTENFYKYFTYRFMKLDNKFIKDKSLEINEEIPPTLNM